MEWTLSEIENLGQIAFDEKMDLTKELKARKKDILDLSEVQVVGNISFDDGFYDLDFKMNYQIILPSTRSLAPVTLSENEIVRESYVTRAMFQTAMKEASEAEKSSLLILEGDTISLSEAVSDNILLLIPSSILTEEEKVSGKFPKGKGWEVLSEDDYQKIKKEQKKEANPFSNLQDFFNES